MKTYWFALAATVALAAGPEYKLLDKIKLGGTNGWDYMAVDSSAERLYVSHTNQVEVIDLKTNKPMGKIADTPGVHGIALAQDLGKGFISNGRDNSVTIFDLKTLAATGKVKTGENPDAILYDSASKKVFAFNGRSHDATIIDAKTGMVSATINVGGKPEFSQNDGKGKVWVNIEDTAELIEIDAAKSTITQRIKLAPCEEPTGLARDAKKNRLFVACSNKTLAVVDPAAGKVLGTVAIGAGADGVAFDSGFAYTSNGADGTITVVGEQGGKWEAVGTIQTTRSARTITVDPKTHRLYLPAAEAGPAPPVKEGKQGRPQLAPDSFHVMVLGK